MIINRLMTAPFEDKLCFVLHACSVSVSAYCLFFYLVHYNVISFLGHDQCLSMTYDHTMICHLSVSADKNLNLTALFV